MFDDRTSRRVGAVVIALVVIAAGAVLTVDCSRLRPGIDVTVYFAHIGALEEGADVELAGRVVGSVQAVQFLPPSAVTDPAHPLHPAGGVAVRLRVLARYASWAAPNGAVFIAVKGVLGDSYIAIGPPPGGAEPARSLRDGDQLRGIDPPRMDQVIVKSFANMTEFRRLVDEVAPSARELATAVDQLGDTIAAIEPQAGAYSALRGALGRAASAWSRLSDGLSAGLAGQGLDGGDALRVIGDAGALIERARAELGATGGALDRLLADIGRIRARIPPDLGVRLEQSIATARAALARLEHTAAVAQELVGRVRGGEGTVGALLNDPEFIDDAKQLGKILKREPWRIVGHPRPEALEKQE